MPMRPPTFRPAAFAAMPREARPSAAARGYDAAWTELRNAFIRTHPVCELCEARGLTRPAGVVDHITPVLVDPSRRLDPANLRSVCTDCHAKLTGRFRAEGINELRTVFATHRTLLGA